MTLERTGTETRNLLVTGAALPDWRRSSGTRIEAGRPVDIRIAGGRIVARRPRLDPLPGEDVLSVAGSVILPGLHDHHIHLRSLAAAARSVAVGPEDVDGHDAMRVVLQAAPTDHLGWRRAVGYFESVAGDLDRWSLDTLALPGPLRVQHRSGALWMVNSAGVGALDLDAADEPGVERDDNGQPTGRMWRMDAWLARRLSDRDPLADARRLSARLAAYGVTGVTDATPDATASGLAGLAAALVDGVLVQRVHAMCPPGIEMPVHERLTRGPHKVLLDDDRLPDLDEMVSTVRSSHGSGSPVAMHCVTPVQLALAVAAFEAAGVMPGDRIEHGAVVPAGYIDAVAAAGLTVVTNPGLVHARGDDYLAHVDERDLPHLYPCASLISAGVAVAAGTDAPFGPVNPWAAIGAARWRRTRSGHQVGSAEAVSLPRAIELFTGWASRPGHGRQLAPGEIGDLCLLGAGAMPEPGAPEVPVVTVVGGQVVHRSD